MQFLRCFNGSTRDRADENVWEKILLEIKYFCINDMSTNVSKTDKYETNHGIDNCRRFVQEMGQKANDSLTGDWKCQERGFQSSTRHLVFQFLNRNHWHSWQKLSRVPAGLASEILPSYTPITKCVETKCYDTKRNWEITQNFE